MIAIIIIIIFISNLNFANPQYSEGYVNEFAPKGEPRHRGNLFVKVGKLANGLSYGHISLSINLTRLSKRVDYFENATHHLDDRIVDLNRNSNIRDPTVRASLTRQISQLLNWTTVQIKETRAKLDTVLEAFDPRTYTGHPNLQSGRPKRFIVSGAIGMLFGGILGSLFTGFGLKTLTSVIERKADVLEAKIEEHDMLIHRSIDDVNTINKTLAQVIGDVSSQVREQNDVNADFMSLYSGWFVAEDLRDIQSTIDGIIAAHHGHFSHELVRSEALQKALNQVRAKALHKGRELGIQTYADCYGLPTSYLYDSDVKVIHLIMHIPMYAMSNNLDLYTYVPTPIVWNNGTDDSPFVEVTSGDQMHLAVSSDRTMYRTFTANELEDCYKISDMHFCADLAVYKIQRPSCLLGLFMNQVSVIREYCKISTHRPSSRVVRLNATTYALMSPFTDSMSISCNGEDRTTQIFKGTTFVNLEPGCSVNTRDVKIVRAEFEPPVNVESLLIGHHFDVEDLIPDHTPDSLQRMLELRKELGHLGSEVPISDLKGLMAFRNRYHSVAVKSADYAVPVIIVTIVLLILILIFCCCWMRNPRCSDAILHREHNARIAEIERNRRSPAVVHYAPKPIIKHGRSCSIGDVRQFDDEEYNDPSGYPFINPKILTRVSDDEDAPPMVFEATNGVKSKSKAKHRDGSAKLKRPTPAPRNHLAVESPRQAAKEESKLQASAASFPEPSAPPDPNISVADLWHPKRTIDGNPYRPKEITITTQDAR